MTESRLALAAFLAMGCSCGAGTAAPVVSSAPSSSAPAVPVAFDVHEWGLVRGTMDDRVMVSGPHAAEPVMVVTKPVLYFHRRGEGELRVDVEARIPNGRVVEHWPTPGGAPGSMVAWRDVLVQGDACHGSRYPTLAQDPCVGLSDGCEAATLASVETTDGNCLYWPRPPDDDGPTEAWNHLFYRGEIDGSPTLPLSAEVQADGSLRLTATGDEAIPGTLLRIRRSHGTAGVSDALDVVTPPAPGASLVVPAPSGPMSGGAPALRATLGAAGLTEQETDAFMRSWESELFGPTPTADVATRSAITTITTTPVLPPPPSTCILYVLPLRAADLVATLQITPAPTEIRRAIAVWIDEAHAHR